MIKDNYLGMVKKIGLLMVAVIMSIAASAQNLRDSTITLFEDLKVPLVEKKYVANTNFQDNWYLSLYGGVTSNFGSDDSHSGFFRLMGPAAMLAVGKELTPISGLRFQINYVRNTGVTDDQDGNWQATKYGDLTHNRFKWNSYGLSIDYLLNFTNLILGFRENRKFHLQGVVGIGGSVSRNYTTGPYVEAIKDITGDENYNSHANQLHNRDKYDNRQHSLICLRGGLAGTFMVARNWNLHVEAVASILDNSYDSNPTTSNTWDGHVDYLLGVSVIDELVPRYYELARFVAEILCKESAHKSLVKWLNDLVAVLDLEYLDTLGSSAVVLTDDNVLRNVNETTGKVTGVGSMESGISKALSRTT